MENARGSEGGTPREARSDGILFAPPHCLNTWKAEHQKEKCPFHFRKKSTPRKSKKQGTFFLFGVAE